MRTTPAEILDVDCGCGCSTVSIASNYSAASVTGIDTNGYSVAIAAIDHPTIKWVHGNTTAMPFHDASFDMVNLDHVISCKTLADIKTTLLEAGRVLRHGGVITILDTSDCATLPEYTYAVDHIKFILEHAGFACVEWAVDQIPGTAMITAWRTVGTPIPVKLAVPHKYFARAKKANLLGMSPFEVVAFVIQFVLAYAWSQVIMDLLRMWLKF
ncbi:S-adenosyl-L-methionine-dependent methyltransferase [Tribonema minus]|uniref:S-adenosyl-L-methionine-dependent methyltransferase n=1 Tax=Tribonema minus TaxID=303371 RepID=A0A835Z4S2_9STRA|nr:S-adenosyl-L-methionine-dependent methyltransferase [Tribonema minus]